MRLPTLLSAAGPAQVPGPRPTWPGSVMGRIWSWLETRYRGPRGGAAIAVVLAVAALATIGTRGRLGAEVVVPAEVAMPAAFLSVAPLAAARRFPMLSVGTVLAANAVFVLFGRLSWPILAVAGWLFALGRCPVLLPPRSARAALVLVEAVVLVAAIIATPANATPWDASLLEALAAATAWGVGESLRVRRASLAEHAADRARVQQAREREAAAREREAAARERAAMARELHDVVAHHVSMIAVRAATAPYSMPALPEPARAAFGEIAVQARTALAELRTVLGVLRTSDGAADQSPQPRLADLPELAQRMLAAGTEVALTVAGTPRPLPESVELCGYRIVQESLTNTGRHAPGARAEVDIDYTEHALVVTVRNDGAPAGAPEGGGSWPAAGARLAGAPAAGLPAAGIPVAGAPATGGLGLIGMRERVAVLDGLFAAGPAAGGGFLVTARLPTPAPVAAAGTGPTTDLAERRVLTGTNGQPDD